ncbi:MFS transporter [Kribbella sp. NPDC000426]|uniref:MFS transporter n=1 Tax=Kribbella sp. NPDC000426 TaxID=3154255 RepID=UPI00331C49D4
MLFAVAMTFIDQTIVAIASPTIQEELALTRTGTSWVVNAYLLALAATFALGGRLADVVGARRLVVIGIVGFAVTSALCGATPAGAAQLWITLFRALQGVSGAIMIPAALSIVVSSFPVHERGRAMALFFTVSGAMTAIGPIAGGWLTQWTWRSIFWINVPIAIVALLLTFAARLPLIRRPARIDLPGAALVAGGMGFLVLGFQQAGIWGWGDPWTLACILLGLALLATFVRLQVRKPNPLINVLIFRDRAFRIDNGVLFLSMIAFVPVFFFASIYAQISLGYDANKSGLYLLLIFAGFAPAAQLGGRMLDRVNAKRPMVLGCVVACVGFALWASKVHDYSLSVQWPFIVMSGAGIGLLLGPASTDAVNRAIDFSYGEVTGITQTVRNFGSTVGMAVLTTVLTSELADSLTRSLVNLGLPPATARAAAIQAAHDGHQHHSTAPPALQSQLHTIVAHDFATATSWVLYGMAIALGLSFLVALRHPGTRVEDDAKTPEATP